MLDLVGKKYYHISLNIERYPLKKYLKINTFMEESINYIKYMPNCYIMYTDICIDKIYRNIKSILDEGEHVFICELNLANRQGWLPKSVWNWIRENYA